VHNLIRDDVTTFLRRSSLFRNLDEAHLDALALKAQSAEFRAGQFLMRTGEQGDAMFIVTSGHVKVATTSDHGAELLINIVEPGGVVGEFALLDGGMRSADVVALEDVKAVKLPRSAFLSFLETHPRACIHLLKILTDKLRLTTRLAEDVAFLSLATRLYRHILVLAKLHGKETDKGLLIKHKMPQKELASAITASRESVNKQLQSWSSLGLVETRTGSILIKNKRALAREAENH